MPGATHRHPLIPGANKPDLVSVRGDKSGGTSQETLGIHKALGNGLEFGLNV